MEFDDSRTNRRYSYAKRHPHHERRSPTCRRIAADRFLCDQRFRKHIAGSEGSRKQRDSGVELQTELQCEGVENQYFEDRWHHHSRCGQPVLRAAFADSGGGSAGEALSPDHLFHILRWHDRRNIRAQSDVLQCTCNHHAVSVHEFEMLGFAEGLRQARRGNRGRPILHEAGYSLHQR